MPTPQEEANLRLVERVYAEILGPIDADAVEGVIAPDYIQHNPNVATGADALRQMLVSARERHPQAEHRVKRMIASGDLVAAHVHVIFQPDTPGFAVVDIFRIADGMIAEHWDVMQPVAPEPKNANGMF